MRVVFFGSTKELTLLSQPNLLKNDSVQKSQFHPLTTLFICTIYPFKIHVHKNLIILMDACYYK